MNVRSQLTELLFQPVPCRKWDIAIPVDGNFLTYKHGDTLCVIDRQAEQAEHVWIMMAKGRDGKSTMTVIVCRHRRSMTACRGGIEQFPDVTARTAGQAGF